MPVSVVFSGLEKGGLKDIPGDLQAGVSGLGLSTDT